MEAEMRALMWFRKGLRIHDNPALLHAVRAQVLYPVFVLDPRYLRPDPSAPSPGSARAGINRIRFLMDCLSDLDSSLRRLGSRLLVLSTRAQDDADDPARVVIRILKDWKISRICFEFDSEPYYQQLGNRVREFASASGIEVFSPVSHTLFDPAQIISKNGGKPPLTYQSFLKIAGEPAAPLADTFTTLPPLGDVGNHEILGVPTLQQLGYGDVSEVEFSPLLGGETEALKRMESALGDKEWIAKFDKPKGDPSAFLKPATTVLSPYLKFGCLSSRYFYRCIIDVYKDVKKHTLPPVSLTGQLMWRDFFYTVAFGTPNFDKMKGNKICKQIPWSDDEKLLAAWRDGKTGFPWIDAIMIQLQRWGWMHHLARHSVACFLTRGDLFIHWEKGRDVFERLLIDSDWSINNGNWLWLSCSSFFYQYNRIYSPLSFGKKYDPNGDFIRHFLPVLKDMPREYIYEPWSAPVTVQRKANCIIGKDYPNPIIDHKLASKDCKTKMGEAYALNRMGSDILQEDLQCSRSKLECEESEAQPQRKMKQRKIVEP